MAEYTSGVMERKNRPSSLLLFASLISSMLMKPPL